MAYPNLPSAAKTQCALQLRGPGQAPRCLSLSYFSLVCPQFLYKYKQISQVCIIMEYKDTYKDDMPFLLSCEYTYSPPTWSLLKLANKGKASTFHTFRCVSRRVSRPGQPYIRYHSEIITLRQVAIRFGLLTTIASSDMKSLVVCFRSRAT